jgi:hypothetical protein
VESTFFWDDGPSGIGSNLCAVHGQQRYRTGLKLFNRNGKSRQGVPALQLHSAQILLNMR